MLSHEIVTSFKGAIRNQVATAGATVVEVPGARLYSGVAQGAGWIRLLTCDVGVLAFGAL